jgi:hypothetical protein
VAEAKTLAFWPEKLEGLKGDDENAERARRMVDAAKMIADLPSEGIRRDRDIDNIRLYESNPRTTLFNFAGRYYSDGSTATLAPPDDSTNNKAKAAIDTVMAQVASTSQRARCVVRDGDWRQRRRGRELQNFCDGLAHELELHKWRKRAALDAAVLESGRGALQFYRDGDRCAVQRILATELIIDPEDGLIDGQPQTIWRHRPMARDQVKATFGGDPRADKFIADAKAVTSSGAPADRIEVWEAWHLPSKKGAKDGWHIVALDQVGGWLLVEPYTKMSHEIVLFGWEDRFTTVWGLSLMTQARKLQRRINANSYRIDRAQKLFHAGHVYLDTTKNVKKSKLTNELGSAWEGAGPDGIKQVTFQAVTAEMYAQVERDGQRIFENLGISQGASEGESSRGLDASAAAMREETKKSDKRNSPRQQNWEANHIDCIKAAIGIVRDIVTHNDNGTKRGTPSGYKVGLPGKRGLTVVDWKDVAIDEANYVLEIKPASPVPTDPAGLVAYGERMIELGAWKPSQLAGYLQDLDADGRVNRTMAPQRRLEKMFESLLYDKVAAAMPDEFTDLKLALELGLDYLEQGQEDGVPEKHLERVRRYLKRCKKLDAAAKMEAQAAAAPPPQLPGPMSQDPAAAAVPVAA